MSSIELQTNENGSAKLCPITTFEVHIATNEMVIVVFQYVETIEEFDSGQPKQLQVVLPAKRAHELAASLEKAATLFLRERSSCLVQ
jgi:hypothetical protein